MIADFGLLKEICLCCECCRMCDTNRQEIVVNYLKGIEVVWFGVVICLDFRIMRRNRTGYCRLSFLYFCHTGF